MSIKKLIELRIVSPRKVLVSKIEEFGCQTSLKMSQMLALKITVVLYPIAFVSLELCSFPSLKKKFKPSYFGGPSNWE